jgi:hypothetical protein
VTENAAGSAGCDVAFQNMQIGAADRRLGDPRDGVGRVSICGIGRCSNALRSIPVTGAKAWVY